MGLLSSIKKVETKYDHENKLHGLGHNGGPSFYDDKDIDELLGYEPRDLQAHMHLELNRFNSLVCHRRFGKTVFCIIELIKAAIECPFRNGRYAYIGPTYDQVEDIAWSYLEEFTRNIPDIKVEKSKLAITIPTRKGGRARIRLYGVDSPKQRLRGLYLDGAVVDEFQDIAMSVWTEQLRPMVSDRNRNGMDVTGRPNQWVIFIGTPKGRNQLYKLWNNADKWMRGLPVLLKNKLTGLESEIFRDDWYGAIHRASETGIIDEAELIAAQIDQGESKYLQEYECSFDAAIEGAIYGDEIFRARKQGRIVGRIGYSHHHPVYTAWDLGWDEHTAIWFIQKIGGQFRVIDYYEARKEKLKHYAKVLALKGYRYHKHFLPHDIAITELGSGKSRRSVLQKYGVRVTTVPKHGVEDGITAVEDVLHKFWFDETKCQEGIDRLSLYQRKYDENLNRFLEKPLHNDASHAADALRQFVMGIRLSDVDLDHDDPDDDDALLDAYDHSDDNNGQTHGEF